MSWLPLVTAGTTVIASGTVAALVTHYLSGNRARKALLREKAELLYECVEEFENAWGQQAVMLAGVVRQEISYDQYNDLFAEAAKSFDGKLYRRVEMISRIYFPKLTPRMKLVFEVRDRFSKLQSLHKAAYRDQDFDAFTWEEDFHPIVLDFRCACEAYKAAVAQCARETFEPLRSGVKDTA